MLTLRGTWQGKNSDYGYCRDQQPNVVDGALERGNPVRVFKGSDFKSNYKDKSYKKERLKGKKELKEWIQ